MFLLLTFNILYNGQVPWTGRYEKTIDEFAFH